MITVDPLYLRYGRDVIMIDLAAEQLLAAAKDNQQIAVEIKTFTQPSQMHSFHLALGQYLNYRLALQSNDPERILLLAIPVDTFAKFQTRDLIKAAIEAYNIKIIVYDIAKEVIVQWI